MSETFVLKAFQQKAFGELCQLAIAFHNYHSLEWMQEKLWEMLTNDQDAITIGHMFSLYEQLEAIIPAVYGLALDPFEGKKTKKTAKKKKAS